MSLSTTSCEAERNFSTLTKIKKKLPLTMIEERLNYLSSPCTEKNITNSLPYEEELKVHSAKKRIENTVEVCQAAN
jgi:hypothetical protein